MNSLLKTVTAFSAASIPIILLQAWIVTVLSMQAPVKGVVWIVMDDVGVECLKPFGAWDGVSRTPSINEIAENGMEFKNFYVEPSCSPTNAAMLTGLIPEQLGIGTGIHNDDYGLDDSVTTVADYLSKHVKTGYFGKIHVFGKAEDEWDASRLGFSEYVTTRSNFVPNQEDYWNYTEYWNGVPVQVYNTYATERVFKNAVDFIERQRNNREDYFVVIRLNSAHYPTHCPPLRMLSTSCDENGDDYHKYHKMIESIDYAVGRFVEKISQDNVLTLMFSDNGSWGGVALPPVQDGRWKHTVYEGGVRMPLIAYWPRSETPVIGVHNGLVSVQDLLPTTCEFFGIQCSPDADFQSVSFYDALFGEPSKRDFVYSGGFQPNDPPFVQTDRMVRLDSWKLVRVNGCDELYNITEDPWENANYCSDCICSNLSGVEAEKYNEILGIIEKRGRE